MQTKISLTKGRIVFFLCFFPRRTETFIHNELIGLQEANCDFQIIALFKASSEWIKDENLKKIVEEKTSYLGFWVWFKGLLKGLRQPRLLIANLLWLSTLKHKNPLFRLRAFSALLVAYELKETIKENKIAYLHAHFASYPTEVVMCLSRLTSIPFGATWHAFDIWKDNNALPDKLNLAEQILTCTQYNVDYLSQLDRVGKNSIKLVYHGLNFKYFPPVTPLKEKSALLAVGRLIPKKGFCHLLEALSILKQKKIIIPLNIIGFPRPYVDRITSGEGNELKRIKQKIKRYGLEKEVRLYGFQPQATIFAMLNESYALIMPSVLDKKNNMDGIPNVILEAMAMQRPVIASNLSGIPEVVKDGVTGFLTEPANANSLAEAIEKLWFNPVVAKQLGYQGRQFVLNKFSLELSTKNCLDCHSTQQIREELDD